jgi:transketolase
MRLAALMGLRVVYVMTHDSIGVGEDGPTHQPIEHVSSLRAMPNMTVMRPGDANEAVEAWRVALNNTNGPTVLALSRQNLPTFDRTAEGFGPASQVKNGGYILYENGSSPDVILLATGSEVSIAYEAAQMLVKDNKTVRVVSMPSWELFDKQDEAYKEEVLPLDVPKVSIEAGTTFGWERWIGNDPKKGTAIGIDHFGASAPASRIYEEFGLTPYAVYEAAKQLVGGL